MPRHVMHSWGWCRGSDTAGSGMSHTVEVQQGQQWRLISTPRGSFRLGFCPHATHSSMQGCTHHGVLRPLDSDAVGHLHAAGRVRVPRRWVDVDLRMRTRNPRLHCRLMEGEPSCGAARVVSVSVQSSLATSKPTTRSTWTDDCVKFENLNLCKG